MFFQLSRSLCLRGCFPMISTQHLFPVLLHMGPTCKINALHCPEHWFSLLLKNELWIPLNSKVSSLPPRDCASSSGAEGSHSLRRSKDVSMTNLCCSYFQEGNGRISLFKEHTSKSTLVPFVPNVSEAKSRSFSYCRRSPPSPGGGVLHTTQGFLGLDAFLEGTHELCPSILGLRLP